jgi:hypothetical protein
VARDQNLSKTAIEEEAKRRETDYDLSNMLFMFRHANFWAGWQSEKLPPKVDTRDKLSGDPKYDQKREISTAQIARNAFWDHWHVT